MYWHVDQLALLQNHQGHNSKPASIDLGEIRVSARQLKIISLSEQDYFPCLDISNNLNRD